MDGKQAVFLTFLLIFPLYPSILLWIYPLGHLNLAPCKQILIISKSKFWPQFFFSYLPSWLLITFCTIQDPTLRSRRFLVLKRNRWCFYSWAVLEFKIAMLHRMKSSDFWYYLIHRKKSFGLIFLWPAPEVLTVITWISGQGLSFLAISCLYPLPNLFLMTCSFWFSVLNCYKCLKRHLLGAHVVNIVNKAQICFQGYVAVQV